MQDGELVERLETTDHLDHDLPDVLLFDELLIVLTLANALEDVAIVRKLHHDAVKQESIHTIIEGQSTHSLD